MKLSVLSRPLFDATLAVSNHWPPPLLLFCNLFILVAMWCALLWLLCVCFLSVCQLTGMVFLASLQGLLPSLQGVGQCTCSICKSAWWYLPKHLLVLFTVSYGYSLIPTQQTRLILGGFLEHSNNNTSAPETLLWIWDVGSLAPRPHPQLVSYDFPVVLG